MIKTIRAQSKFLLGGLFVLISASFLIIYNIPQFEAQMQGANYGKIDGREVTTEQHRLAAQSAQESTRLTYNRDLSSRSELWYRVTWERLILLAEARKMGVQVTDHEVVEHIRQLPVFQKDGKFNSEGYDLFQKNYLPSQNLTLDRFEQIMREDVTIQKVREAIFSPVQVDQAEINRTLLEYFGIIKVNLVLWNKADLLKDLKVDQAAIDKEYHDHATNADYRTLERRRVAFVLFPLSPEEAKLPEAEKAKAKRALGEKATDFAVAVLDKSSAQVDGWESVIKERGLEAVTTEFFNKNEAPQGLPPSPNFNRAAFQLTKDLSVSEAVELEGGYAVLRLVEIQPSELRPLDQVRSLVEQNARQQSASDELLKLANAASVALKSATQSGKPFLTAAQELKLTVESPAPFSTMNLPPNLKEGRTIAEATRSLQPGAISPVLPTETGAMLIELESRTEGNKMILDMMRPQVESELLQQRQGQLYEEWMRMRNQSPDIVLPLALQPK